MQKQMHRSFLLAYITAICALLLLMGCDKPANPADRLATAWLNRINAEIPGGDVDKFMELWAEGAVQTGPGGNQKGTLEIREFFAGFRDRWSAVKHNELTRVIQGNQAALRVDWVGKSVDGKSVRFPIAFFLEFDGNGQVAANHVYFDIAAIRKQLE